MTNSNWMARGLTLVVCLAASMQGALAGGGGIDDGTVTAVAEPASMALLAAGAAGLYWSRRRRGK